MQSEFYSTDMYIQKKKAIDSLCNGPAIEKLKLELEHPLDNQQDKTALICLPLMTWDAQSLHATLLINIYILQILDG